MASAYQDTIRKRQNRAQNEQQAFQDTAFGASTSTLGAWQLGGPKKEEEEEEEEEDSLGAEVEPFEGPATEEPVGMGTVLAAPEGGFKGQDEPKEPEGFKGGFDVTNAALMAQGLQAPQPPQPPAPAPEGHVGVAGAAGPAGAAGGPEFLPSNAYAPSGAPMPGRRIAIPPTQKPSSDAITPLPETEVESFAAPAPGDEVAEYQTYTPELEFSITPDSDQPQQPQPQQPQPAAQTEVVRSKPGRVSNFFKGVENFFKGDDVEVDPAPARYTRGGARIPNSAPAPASNPEMEDELERQKAQMQGGLDSGRAPSMFTRAPAPPTAPQVPPGQDEKFAQMRRDLAESRAGRERFMNMPFYTPGQRYAAAPGAQPGAPGTGRLPGFMTGKLDTGKPRVVTNNFLANAPNPREENRDKFGSYGIVSG